MPLISPARRPSFWILAAGSLALTGYGAYSVTQRLGTMEVGLLDGTATTADVYAGQSWAVLESVLTGAGVIGVIASLVVLTLAPRAAATVVTAMLPEPVPAEAEPAWEDALETPATDTSATVTEAAPAAEPTAGNAAPTADDTPAAATDTVTDTELPAITRP